MPRSTEFFAFALLALTANPSAAQDYPARPIRFIVPFTAGGLDASSEQGSRLRDANVREPAAAAVLLAQASVSSKPYPERPIRFIVPFTAGGLDASSEQGSRLRDANVRESAAAAVLLAQASVSSKPYPERPIRFIVPFTAGGGGDLIIREVSQRLTARLGQSVVVDNRTGAGGNVGTELAAHAPADGYTLLMANVAPMAINTAVYKKLPYDPVRDFAPITLLASFPNVLVVNPAVPAHNVAELIALARAQPGQLTCATAGTGSTTHLAAEFFRSKAKIDFIQVPYKGGGAALVDLVAGQINMYFGALPGALPHIRTGRLRALGVTSLTRSGAAPGIPAIAEAGFPGFEAVTWIGVVAPAHTPKTIVARLNREITDIVRAPEMREKLLAEGAEPATDTPEHFAAYIRSEIDKWTGIVKLAGITAQ